MDERYIEKVLEYLQAELPECEVHSHIARKNNGVELHGVRIGTKDSSIEPVLYLDGYYEQGYSEKKCAISLAERYEEVNRENFQFDVKSLTDFEAVKDKICYKVINKDANADLLQNTPYLQLNDSDLVCVFYIDLDKQASITIHDGMIEMWGISEDDLYDIANENTQRIYSVVDFKPLNEIIADIMYKSGEMEMIKLQMGVPEDVTLDEFKGMFIEMVNSQCPAQMYVLSAHDCSAGASVIMYDDLLSKVHEKLGSDYVIFPSSTHEVIVMPYADDMSVEELQEIVKTVNQQEVSPEERLSDNVYYFDGKELSIMTEEMVTVKNQQPVFMNEAR